MPDAAGSRPRIAVFSGPTATIHNAEPFVTSNKARAKYGLPMLVDAYGRTARFDVLRPQRLAAPVTAYVDQFSAHPLESDAADLYGPPDGYLGPDGTFRRDRSGPQDRPVYEIHLEPEDGLYPLPYMARQADGRAWEGDCADPFADASRCRQPFYPDASRIFEEIDRLGVSHAGVGSLLASKADFDFYRAAPPGGYKRGLAAADRTDQGSGDVPPEVMGEDFFNYRPHHLARQPTAATLARLTSLVQRVLDAGTYVGAIWLEGTPTIEETIYWLDLLVDTAKPIVGAASQRPHGAASNDGDRNIVDAVDYIVSGIWADPDGRDRIGAVLTQDERVFTAREVQKGDARPGGYVTTGGHGGLVASMGDPGPPALTFLPVRLHTYRSMVNLHQLPETVGGVQLGANGIDVRAVPVASDDGLNAGSIPNVGIVKGATYLLRDPHDGAAEAADVVAQIERNLRSSPLSGFVAEGLSPFGTMNTSIDAALKLAVFSGMPVVRVGRGNAEGFTPPAAPFLGGGNLTATKARLLLMACLLRYGTLPPAADPTRPTSAERSATHAALATFQRIFDTH